MEKLHLSQLRRKFPETLEGKQVVCLHIPDDYEFMQPEVIDELQGKLALHIELPDGFPRA